MRFILGSLAYAVIVVTALYEEGGRTVAPIGWALILALWIGRIDWFNGHRPFDKIKL